MMFTTLLLLFDLTTPTGWEQLQESGLDAMRQLMWPGAGVPFLSVRVELVILSVQAVVYFWAAHRLLNYMELRSRQEGTLTLRYQ